ncbi:MAG: GNAT family N-acetyltransferase [Clostridiales bacterium]|nr:GNAT family N-acetyltransferase [Clostridiales bacterium]
MINLKPITENNVLKVCELSDTLSENHKKMVKTNALSIAQAYTDKYALPRAIYNDDELVGFIMMYYGPDDEKPDEDIAYLWRFMVATDFQGRGFGRDALKIIFDEVKQKGIDVLYASCAQGEGSPLEFYKSVGFVETGDMNDDQVVIKVNLND